MANRKRANNDLQNTTQKNKDRTLFIISKRGYFLWCMLLFKLLFSGSMPNRNTFYESLLKFQGYVTDIMCHRYYMWPTLYVTDIMCHRHYVSPTLYVTDIMCDRHYVSPTLCVPSCLYHLHKHFLSSTSALWFRNDIKFKQPYVISFVRDLWNGGVFIWVPWLEK